MNQSLKEKPSRGMTLEDWAAHDLPLNIDACLEAKYKHASLKMYRIACAQDENLVVYFDKSGNKHIRKGGNLSWRINNPGLVKSHSHYARSNGSIGSCQGFVVFSYPEQGHKILSDWLHSKKYYNSTVQVIAEHYHLKNADAFAIKLSSSISVPLDKKLKSFTNIEFQKLLKAIEKSCGYELIRIFTFGGGSFVAPGKCHPDSYNFASAKDLVFLLGFPNLRTLAMKRYIGLKEGLSLEQILSRLAQEDTIFYKELQKARKEALLNPLANGFV